jgi:pimeloyl-ACP methyl ester carboxylesterase
LARTLRAVSVSALTIMAVLLLPPVEERIAAVGLLAESIGLDVPRPLVPEVRRVEVRVGGVTGDLYLTGLRAPLVVIVPGAVAEAHRDARTVRVARAVAGTGRVVFVPQLELADERVDEADVERIVRATAALDGADLTEGGTVLLGFSFGGSFALLAAADRRIAERVALVAVFGAYWDLTGVIQGVTTGFSTIDGGRVRHRPHPDAPAVLDKVALDLVAAPHRSLLRAALAGAVDPEALPASSRTVFDLLRNRDPERTFSLASALPREVWERLKRFSPASVAERIEAPVLAMHSVDDPAVPYGEALRLDAALPDADVLTVTLFEHVDVQDIGWVSAVDDVLDAWSFATALVAAG